MSQVSTSTKAYFGLGFSARGIKDGLFQMFLFFYFSQVLGLDAALAGTASLLSLSMDAITDPMVGFISDKWNSKKWGRRHPFMFWSALPLGISTWLLFLPPEGLSEMGLFWWLLIFSILVRVFLTFFIVPGMSLGAELSTDYKERTTIASARIMFAAFVSPVVLIVGYVFYFVPTETISNGLFNVEAYPKFAFLCGILMIITILISVWGTRHVVPSLPQASEKQSTFGLKDLFRSLRIAVKMRSFRNLGLFIMLIYIGLGIGVVFSPYFGPYYFGMSAQQMAVLPIGSAVGGIIALLIAPSLGERMDKKWAALLGTLVFGVFFSLPYFLRMVDLFPENGSAELVAAYTVLLVIAYCFLWVCLSLAQSMMAEVVDEYELYTGDRQEGLFFATMSFAYKCTTGVGQFIAGLLLTWISFPKQVSVEEMPQRAIDGLGWVGGPILLCFYLVGIVFIIRYPITKNRYQEIRLGLREEI